MIYLDHAAATPMDPAVQKAMQPYLADNFYNPSATYLPAQAVSKELAAARARVAKVLGAKPAEIIFTAGGTESNNLAIRGIMSCYPKSTVVVGAIEHESVLQPAALYRRIVAPVSPDGTIDLDKLAKLITDDTALVSVMYANNEIGTIQPIKKVAQLVADIRSHRQKRKVKQPLYLHTDACQAANYLDLHVSRLGVDLMTLNGGKIYGPKQSGVLYVRGGVDLEPLIYGGGHERGLRSGTENVAADIGFAKALEITQTKRHAEAKRLQALQYTFFKALKHQLPNVVINGSLNHRLPNNIHLTLPGQDNERLLIKLEEQGILAAAGSACSASNEEPSHVLRAIGLSDNEAQSSIRLTAGRTTTQKDIAHTINALSDTIHNLRT